MEAAVGDQTGEALSVGRRFVCEGHYGIIKYVGKIPPTSGLWLGVEWDEPTRGKHNGDHEGMNYFTCSKKNSGSFVRPKKVNIGTTFIQAVRERYGGGEVEELYVGTKPVEMVGLEKIASLQSQLDKLNEVSVRGMLVSSVGKPGEVMATTPGIVKLDLSQNHLLSSWEVISGIASQLKSLTLLQLSENSHLSIPSSPLSHISSFTALRALFINKMCWTWKEVIAVLKMTPQLEELHACENKIAEISNEEDLPQNLTLLNLEENDISDWSSVLKFCALPRLQTLILNDNKLESIVLERVPISSGGGSFKSLESISLCQNLISHWTSINSLALLPSLTDLKFKGNPLINDEPVSTVRQLIIAHMENLKILNNSQVTTKERQLAERYYLKRYASDFIASQSSKGLQDFLQIHPRIHQLISVHGLPEGESQISNGKRGDGSTLLVSASLKEALISLMIKCPDDPNQKELVKKLPVTMTIQKLKGFIQRHFKVDSSAQKLSYLDKKGGHEIEMLDSLRQLSFYSIEDGDTLLVRKTPKAQ